MNHPVDALGKLRITELIIDGPYAHLELDYLSGACRTSVTYKQGVRDPLRIDHIDEAGIHKQAVEYIIADDYDSIVNFIIAKRHEKPGKTDYSMEQLQAKTTKELEKIARLYKIDTEGKNFQQVCYAIWDAQIDSRNE